MEEERGESGGFSLVEMYIIRSTEHGVITILVVCASATGKSYLRKQNSLGIDPENHSLRYSTILAPDWTLSRKRIKNRKSGVSTILCPASQSARTTVLPFRHGEEKRRGEAFGPEPGIRD